jgi:RimJ/RimL family protein N-acetyltransferase
MNIDARHRRVEIGSTWYRHGVQRSPLNTQCKRLLLGHAFDTLDCIAVEFRTHRLNTQSRRAIERLGAQLDGILRAHQIASDGTVRDTAVYSVTAAEWPAVRSHLDWQLTKPR